jgi:methylamine dehydrogenase heavy chain
MAEKSAPCAPSSVAPARGEAEYRRARGSVWRWVAGVSLVGTASLAAAQDGLDPGAQSQLAESHTTAKLSPTHARRLFVLDLNFPNAQAAKTYVIDGNTGAMEGMFNQAYWPNFAIAPDGKELYAVDSYWEKHTRGKRSDYIVVRDAQTLDVKEDIALPGGRLLIVSKKFNFAVTPDGRYGLTYNLAPSTAVTVTDLVAHKTIGDVSIPGCGLIFAQAANRFSSLCADGGIVTATFDSTATATFKRAEHVFDAKNDPAFEHSAWDQKGQLLYLITYHGDVIPVDLSGEQAAALPKWSLATAAERKQGWLPGGWQLSHFHAAQQRIFVLMHQGRYWTHKEAGSEVWVFDARSGKRMNRIKLKRPAISVAVSSDEDPLVYALTESGHLYAYRSSTGTFVYRTEPVGTSPALLTVWGE